MTPKQTQQKKIDIKLRNIISRSRAENVEYQYKQLTELIQQALADQRQGYVDALKQELKLSRFGEGHNKGILTAIKLIEQEEEPTR